MRVVILLMLLAAPAAAADEDSEVRTIECVEWQTIDSDAVVRGFVSAVHERRQQYVVTLRVVETIKGGARQIVRFTTPMGVLEEPVRWRAKRTDLLVYLDTARDVPGVDPDITHVLRPASMRESSTFVLGVDATCTSEIGVARTPRVVLARARAWHVPHVAPVIDEP